LLKRCENNVKQIAIKGNDGNSLSEEEKIVRLNVMRGMANKIRNESKNFRLMQKDFLYRLKERDASGNEFFDQDQINGVDIEDIVEGKLSQDQIESLNEIRKHADEREKEIIRIAQSVNELAAMFKELSVLIVEQGSILDRIDYNIEQAQVKVAAGKKEVVKADEYSKASAKRSLFCIFLLLIAIAVCIGLLILKYKH
jgi:syntaxin 16